jgi:hypothetical protein
MRTSTRITVAIIGSSTSLLLAAACWVWTNFGFTGDLHGTLGDRIGLAWAGVFIAVAVGCIVFGMVGPRPFWVVSATVVVALFAIPAMLIAEFGSLSVDQDTRVALCGQKYDVDNRLLNLADAENISIRIEELIADQCNKHRDALSMSGKLPTEISAAQVKNFARSIPAIEKCENKYLSKLSDPRLPDWGAGGVLEAYCAELSAAGDLRADGSTTGKFNNQRFAELAKIEIQSQKCTDKYGTNLSEREISNGTRVGIEDYCAELSAAGNLRPDGSIIGKFSDQRVAELTEKAFEKAGLG